MVGSIRSRGDRVFDACNVAFMLILSVVFLYPFWHMVALSLGDDVYSRQFGLKLFPFGHFTLSNYKFILAKPEILIGYKNTLIRTVLAVVWQLSLTYMTAYGLSRRNLPLKKALTLFFLFTMFFSGGLVPSYINIRNLKLLNTMAVLILPGGISVYNVLIARNFILGLPYELEEAATIDGAHPLRVMVQIMLPLSMPVLSVLVLWISVAHWNAWYDAMLYNNKSDLMVLQNVLRSLTIEMAGNEETRIMQGEEGILAESVKAAAIIVSTLPIICLYPFLQKGFRKGLVVGSLKG